MPLTKKMFHLSEAAFLYVFFLICRLLPLDAASGMGGWIGRTLGPRLAASRKALANIELALPDLPAAERRKIVRQMWDNLGRVIAEYPHLQEIARTRISVSDPAPIANGNERKNAFYISGHFANWEAMIQILALRMEKPVGAVYRAPNNPWVNRLLDKTRASGGKVETYPKSKSGTRQMMKAIQRHMPIGLLIDQKYNEGVAVPFFGHPAMTGHAFVQLAQKFDYQVIPCRIERRGGAHFHATVYDALRLRDADGHNRAAEDVVADAHTLMEAWIRETPGDWLWLHRRWPGPEKRQMLQEQIRRRAAGQAG